MPENKRMRAIFTFSLLFGLSICCLGQHVLTATNANPLPGDIIKQDIADNINNFNPGSSGANVTWDFSGLNAPDTGTILIRAANDTNFASADIYFTQAGADAYFGTSNASFQFYGFDAGQVQVSFSDPEDQIRYPFAYGDSFIDTKLGSSSGFGQTAQRRGNIEVEADAHGTLITPDGNYPNALRLKYVRHDTDYFNGSAVNISTDTIYYWYHANFRFPLMSYVNLWQNGSQVYTSVSYIQDNSFGQSEPTRPEPQVFPNPAKDIVKLTHVASNSEVALYDLRGTLLQSFTDYKSIDLSEFSSGVYVLQVSTQDGERRNLKIMKL